MVRVVRGKTPNSGPMEAKGEDGWNVLALQVPTAAAAAAAAGRSRRDETSSK